MGHYNYDKISQSESEHHFEHYGQSHENLVKKQGVR